MKPIKKSLVEEGSGNVFADLGLPNADDLQTKTELTRQLYQRIKPSDFRRSKLQKCLG